MYSVFIADDNVDWLEILSTAIDRESKFEVVAKARDGRTAIELIEQLRPDIVLLDIIMPQVDGVQVVNHIKTNLRPYSPIIYVLSGIGTDHVIKILSDLDISFYNMKPVSFDLVIENLHKLVENNADIKGRVAPGDKEESVLEVLYQLGLRPYNRKTHYIKDALMFYLSEPDTAYSLTKIVYPTIAKKHGVTASSVERSIRYAIAQLNESRTDLFKDVFAYASAYGITNSEFFSFVANHIERSMK